MNPRDDIRDLREAMWEALQVLSGVDRELVLAAVFEPTPEGWEGTLDDIRGLPVAS